jgi:hypothetical protein
MNWSSLYCGVFTVIATSLAIWAHDGDGAMAILPAGLALCSYMSAKDGSP